MNIVPFLEMLNNSGTHSPSFQEEMEKTIFYEYEHKGLSNEGGRYFEIIERFREEIREQERQRREEERRRQEEYRRQELERKRNLLKKRIRITIATMLIISLVVLVFVVVIPLHYYNRGCTYMNKGNWDEAITSFQTASSFSNVWHSKQKEKESHYFKAEALAAKGETEEAIREYELADDYSDASAKLSLVISSSNQSILERANREGRVVSKETHDYDSDGREETFVTTREEDGYSLWFISSTNETERILEGWERTLSLDSTLSMKGREYQVVRRDGSIGWIYSLINNEVTNSSLGLTGGDVEAWTEIYQVGDEIRIRGRVDTVTGVEVYTEGKLELDSSQTYFEFIEEVSERDFQPEERYYYSLNDYAGSLTYEDVARIYGDILCGYCTDLSVGDTDYYIGSNYDYSSDYFDPDIIRVAFTLGYSTIGYLDIKGCLEDGFWSEDSMEFNFLDPANIGSRVISEVMTTSLIVFRGFTYWDFISDSIENYYENADFSNESYEHIYVMDGEDFEVYCTKPGKTTTLCFDMY